MSQTPPAAPAGYTTSLVECRELLTAAKAESGGQPFPFAADLFPNDTAFRQLRRELADDGWTMNLEVDVENGDYFTISRSSQ